MQRPIGHAAWMVLLAACSGGAAAPSRDHGAELFRAGFERAIIDTGGRETGRLAGVPGREGLTLRIAVRGLPPGQHGMHLHEAGRCDPPRFASAGAHWNAAGKLHGHDNSQGPHDGDLGNLAVGADGSGAAERLIPRYHGTFPPAGLALVIHADPDDERTDPTGNSGTRSACAVVLAART